MATFAYTRVSTPDQTTENQKLEIENAGYKIDFWFSDVCSGKLSAFERAEFSILMDRIRDGETLVVSKLDRLGRDSIDILQTIEKLSKRDIKIIVLQLGNLDLNSSAGKMMLTMLAAVAEMERNLIVERINTGLVRARAQGKKFGRPPCLKKHERLKVKEMLKEGIPKAHIARAMNVSAMTIFRINKED